MTHKRFWTNRKMKKKKKKRRILEVQAELIKEHSPDTPKYYSYCPMLMLTGMLVLHQSCVNTQLEVD